MACTMPLIDTIKSVVPGTGADAPTYRCTECGTTFESLEDEDSYWLSCPDCESDEVQLAEAN